MKDLGMQGDAANGSRPLSNLLTGITAKRPAGLVASPNTRCRTSCAELGVLGNKHIPQAYLINQLPRRTACACWPGLIDSDGHLDPVSNGYEITQKELQELAQSD